mmetsp:Transcript_5248/g.17668  ORF Transcript_5248/g.17668 Transcript_5248/m.17668 type:complete len:110 (-) Transcript_5248:546-875(-)
MDESLGFFKAVGGGEVDRKSIAGFLWKAGMAFNPFVSTRLSENMKLAKGTDGNLKGEGLITGGLYVIRQGGAVEYAFREAEIGDPVPMDEVVAAAQRAAYAAQSACDAK